MMMFLALASEGYADIPLSYWTVFTSKIGAAMVGFVLLLAVWAVWLVIAGLLFKPREGEVGDRPALAQLAGMLAIACGVYFGLVFMIG